MSWPIRLADAAVILLLLLSARILVDGGIEFEIAGWPVSAGSASRPAVFAAIVFALRHWRQPKPWLGARIGAFIASCRREPQTVIARAFIVSRFGVLGIGLLAVLTFGVPPSAVPRSRNPVLDLPDRWDAGWYIRIARSGYAYDPRKGERRQQSIAFFPAYPLLVRLVSVVAEPQPQVSMSAREFEDLREGRVLWSASVISLVFFLAALVVFYRWAAERAGPESAAGAVVLLSAYPFALFFGAPYTESMFLFGAVATFYAFERERWPIAFASGLLVGLTRPNGAMLSLALAVLALRPALAREPSWIRRVLVGLATAAAPGIGMLVFSAYIYTLASDPFVWVDIQQAWGRSPDNTAGQFAAIYNTIRDKGFLVYLYGAPIQFLQLLATIFAVALLWPVWRHAGAAYAVFVLANLVPPLVTGGVMSMGRMTSTMFPLFFALALVVPAERRGAWVLAFGMLQALLAALFYTWRPVF